MSEFINLDVESVYNYLVGIANNKDNTLTYSEMEKKCGLEHSQINVQALVNVLNMIMLYNKMNGEPFLSTLVINADKQIPGSGFFKALKYLNVEVTSEKSFFVEQIQKIRVFDWDKFEGFSK